MFVSFFTIYLIFLSIQGLSFTEFTNKKCNIPAFAPERVEKIINECQEEIKAAILSEVLQVYSNINNLPPVFENRTKRELSDSIKNSFTDDERRIAGCLLQCVYKKVNALDTNLLPLKNGLVDLYTNGVDSRFYFSAVTKAVDTCLTVIDKEYGNDKHKISEEKSCDIAYDTFECISNKVSVYCGQTP